jgi:hypothetical protein
VRASLDEVLVALRVFRVRILAVSGIRTVGMEPLVAGSSSVMVFLGGRRIWIQTYVLYFSLAEEHVVWT